jgi:hypothetical protein
MASVELAEALGIAAILASTRGYPVTCQNQEEEEKKY